METLIKQDEISGQKMAELTLEAIRVILDNVLKRVNGRFEKKLELRPRTETKTFGPSGTMVFEYRFFQLAKVKKGFLFKTRESIITSGSSNPKKNELVFEVFDRSVVKDLKQEIDNSDFFKKFDRIQPVILEK